MAGASFYLETPRPSPPRSSEATFSVQKLAALYVPWDALDSRAIPAISALNVFSTSS
jgi:hypothetical protein